MHCGQDRNKLAAYLDRELSADDSKVLQDHVRTCPDCAAEVAAIVTLRRALKPAASRFAPSADFRQKVHAKIAPRRSAITRWLWPAAAAVLAVALLAVVWTRQSGLRGATFREVADLHISDLASANPYDVISSDRHTVKPWFQGKIPFAFNLPEFAGTDFTLLGGRLVYLHQQPAAQVVVGARQHKISVLILQESSVPGTAFAFSRGVAVRDSFNVETWQQRELRFFVIGDADKPAIEQISQLLQNANN
jgi:anti-sigma factor RsiW